MRQSETVCACVRERECLRVYACLTMCVWGGGGRGCLTFFENRKYPDSFQTTTAKLFYLVLLPVERWNCFKGNAGEEF